MTPPRLSNPLSTPPIINFHVLTMRPLMLHGHERAITQIRYNYDGDLLFSVAKDHKPTVWYSDNGERLGTYNGHNGAVWCIDVNLDSTLVLTGAADDTAKLWDCEKGVAIQTWNTSSAIRSCGFSHLGNLLMFSTEDRKDVDCEIFVYDTRSNEGAVSRIKVEGERVSSGLWGPFDEFIITGHADGKVRHYDYRNNKCIKQQHMHRGTVTDLQLSQDKTMIITSSKDCNAMLYDVDELSLIKTFRTDRPVNSAAISPIKDHVVLGGGQEAMEVTTTTTKSGKFEAKFFHLIHAEEIGRVKGHFGPINSLKFHPNGKSYSSGGEDGYVRVHNFDPSYFEFEIEF